MSRLTRNGTVDPVSREQILRRERGQGNIHFPCSADHEQDWQPYPVDPYMNTNSIITVFSLHGESVIRFPFPGGVFLPSDNGGLNF